MVELASDVGHLLSGLILHSPSQRGQDLEDFGQRAQGSHRGASPRGDRSLEIYASSVWASADLALPDSGYSVG
jgi:hypothetical protein